MSGLPAEYIPMLNQLRTIVTRLDHGERNAERSVCQRHLAQKAKKNPLRGYRSQAAMTTTTMAKHSGKKRDVSEVVCHDCKVKGHYANKCPAKKPIPGDTTTKWCSLHKTRSHSDNECMAQQSTPQSLPPISALPATISPTTETCSFTFVPS